MSVINEQTKTAWQDIADQLSLQRPSVGRRIRVDGGRKHKGRTGAVVRHEQDKFATAAFRYGNEASHQMREMRGRYGFVVLVQPDDGSKRFWVKADQVTCLDDDGNPCLDREETKMLAKIRETPGELQKYEGNERRLVEMGLIEIRDGRLWLVEQQTEEEAS